MENYKGLIFRGCDAHCVFDNKEAVKLFIKGCYVYQPKIIILDEWTDFGGISKFIKKPEAKFTVWDEISAFIKYLEQIRKYCPKSRIIILKSNHTDRFFNLLWTKAEELSNFPDLQIENLFRLKRMKCEYVDFIEIAGVRYTHTLGKGMNTERMINKLWSNLSIGHLHYPDIRYFNRGGNSFFVQVCGCLCETKPNYDVDDIKDWTNGFATNECFGDWTRPHNSIISNGKCSILGRILSL